jgi:hypothetical protein
LMMMVTVTVMVSKTGRCCSKLQWQVSSKTEMLTPWSTGRATLWTAKEW